MILRTTVTASTTMMITNDSTTGISYPKYDMNILAPMSMGVLYAGWIEAGMLAGSLVKKVGSNSIAFSEEDDV